MNRRLNLLAVLLLLSTTAFAQSFKVGYTFIDAIVASMPEMTQINADLEVYQTQLTSQVNTKRTTIQNKMNEFEALRQQPNAAQLVLQEKSNEILRLQDDLEKFSGQAEQAFAAKQAELLQPVYTKVQNAIMEVRKEKGYHMIINSRTSTGAQVILAADEADDVTEAVFAKLGVAMPEAQVPTPADSTGSGN